MCDYIYRLILTDIVLQNCNKVGKIRHKMVQNYFLCRFCFHHKLTKFSWDFLQVNSVKTSSEHTLKNWFVFICFVCRCCFHQPELNSFLWMASSDATGQNYCGTEGIFLLISVTNYHTQHAGSVAPWSHFPLCLIYSEKSLYCLMHQEVHPRNLCAWLNGNFYCLFYPEWQLAVVDWGKTQSGVGMQRALQS